MNNKSKFFKKIKQDVEYVASICRKLNYDNSCDLEYSPEIWMSKKTFDILIEYSEEEDFPFFIEEFGNGLEGISCFGFPIVIKNKLDINEIYVNIRKKDFKCEFI